MNYQYIITAILIVSLVTFILRALPFSLGFFLKKSAFIQYIKNRFPMIMMLILTLYAVNVPKAHNVAEIFPELMGVCITGLCHWFFRNFFLSIFVGTMSYIVLVNFL